MTKRSQDYATARVSAAETAAAAAVALASKAAATADALASAKAATDTAAALLAADILRIKADLNEIKLALQSGYVTQERFHAFETDLSSAVKQAELHAARITVLETAKAESAGKGDGMKAMYGWITAGISILIMIASFLIPHLK